MQVESDDTDELAEAMTETQQRWRTPASTPPPHDRRNAAGHPAAYPDQPHASGRPRTPSQSVQRRNSFDERRIPPTLLEDVSAQHTLETAPSPTSAHHRSGMRSRSGTTSSHKLLRRVSSDTVQSMDFDSDVGDWRSDIDMKSMQR